MISVAGAGAGAVAAPLVIKAIPEAVPAKASSALIAAAGGFLAYKGLKRRIWPSPAREWAWQPPQQPR